MKSLSDLHDEFVDSVSICCSQQAKKDRWVRAINGLESDKSFSEMNSVSLASLPEGDLRINARKCIQNMSSGHAIIMLTITKLIATVEEKTLVLIDEPESHLHPPLLSAFIRALSELLHDRNGVAIVATHSPVVLQEIPSSCVWKINRIKDVVKNSRPDVETFGENVGVLTREVFGLEVVASGFHKMLLQSVKDGCGYDEILSSYDGQLGFEARAILRAMIASRDEGGFNEKDKSTWV
ncbi:ATP-binding protein [Chromobacterium haemolyticum]|nr:ATP-binding protein [Chromobacterium haemolyticum]